MAEVGRRATAARKPRASGLIRPGQVCGVVSGDIVASSRYSQEDRRQLHRLMKQASDELHHLLHPAIPLDVDIYSGDAWQMLVLEPRLALKAALFYRASLLAGDPAADTRLAIAVGAVDFIPGKRVSEGQGEAFRLSGRALQEMHTGPRMRFCSADENTATTWNAVVRLLDVVISQHWSAARARAVVGALRGWDQKRIARLWNPPIKQSSVSKHLRGATWSGIEAVMAAFSDAWSTAV